MRVSKKLAAQIVEAIRAASSEVCRESLPNCDEAPPDQWTAEETARFDLLVDVERKAVEAVEPLLAA